MALTYEFVDKAMLGTTLDKGEELDALAKLSTEKREELVVAEAKEAAREIGIDDNQSKLLKVAAAPAEEQVAVEHQLTAKTAKLTPSEIVTQVDSKDKLKPAPDAQIASFKVVNWTGDPGRPPRVEAVSGLRFLDEIDQLIDPLLRSETNKERRQRLIAEKIVRYVADVSRTEIGFVPNVKDHITAVMRILKERCPEDHLKRSDVEKIAEMQCYRDDRRRVGETAIRASKRRGHVKP